MKKIESLMILQGVNVTELMQAAGLERATYYYIKKKGGTSPRTLKAIADTLHVDPRELLSEQEKAQRELNSRIDQLSIVAFGLPGFDEIMQAAMEIALPDKKEE